MNYVYTDPQGHTLEVSHKASESPQIICPVCQNVMWRKPQAVRVNWKGLPPHMEGTRPPDVQDMISNQDRNRETYLAGKASR